MVGLLRRAARPSVRMAVASIPSTEVGSSNSVSMKTEDVPVTPLQVSMVAQ